MDYLVVKIGVSQTRGPAANSRKADLRATFWLKTLSKALQQAIDTSTAAFVRAGVATCMAVRACPACLPRHVEGTHRRCTALIGRTVHERN